MKKKLFLWFIVLIIQFIIPLVLCEDINGMPNLSNRLSMDLSGRDINPFVRMTSDGSIGSSTNRNGLRAVLWPISSDIELNEFINVDSLYIEKELKGKKGIIVFNSLDFATEDNLVTLESTPGVDAVVFAIENTTNISGVSSFSPERSYPNKESSLHPDSSHIWNTEARSLIRLSFPNFPLFVFSNEAALSVWDAALYNKNNTEISVSFTWPRYSIDLKSFMHTNKDINNERCLYRRHCQPIGGRSLYGSFSDSKSEIIVLTSKIDATALFHPSLTPGAGSTVAPLVASIAALDAIGKLGPIDFERQILFTFFDADSWDFTGSNRFLNDIINFECQEGSGDICTYPPRTSLAFKDINLNNIVNIVEIGGLGYSNNNEIHIHREEPVNADTLNLINLVSNIASEQGVTVSQVSGPQGIPPSTEHSWIRHFDEQGISRPGTILLADHGSTFNNPFYSSMFDSADNIDLNDICITSNLLAKTLVSLANNTSPDFNVSCDHINSLFDCFTRNFSCDFVLETLPFLNPALIPDTGLDMGTGVADVYGASIRLGTKFLHDYLANAAARSDSSNSECNNGNNPCQMEGEKCIKEKCVKSSVHYHYAIPSGIEWKYYQWIFESDPNGFQWTESNWNTFQASIYRMENPSIAYISIIPTFLLCIVSYFLLLKTKKTL